MENHSIFKVPSFDVIVKRVPSGSFYIKINQDNFERISLKDIRELIGNNGFSFDHRPLFYNIEDAMDHQTKIQLFEMKRKLHEKYSVNK